MNTENKSVFIRVHLWLENVSKLKLPDTSTIYIPNQQVSSVETEIIERRISHITSARCELRRIERVEIIEANLESIILKPRKAEVDCLSQTKIQPVLFWTTQNIPTRQPSSE